MVAYVIDDVFMQLWIGAEDKLPRVIHAVSLDDGSRFRRYLELSNWQIDVAIAPDTFAPSSAPDAKRVEFVQAHPQLPLGARPPAKVPKVQQ